MKMMFKITSLLILVTLLGSVKTTLAVEKTKKYHESWSASSVETLDISNKFGEVKFKNDGGAEITIDVIVTVEASSDSKANELLNKIDVNFSKSGNVVKAVTSIENNFRSQRSFSIDYTVNAPSDKNLRVANKYGNVVVNRLTGTGEFDVQYGNITAVSLKGVSTRLNLAYGKGNIDETGDLETDISYSNISFGETGDLRLNSKYSTVDLDKAKNIQNSAKQILEQHGGVVPNTMQELTILPGVARKTANIVLGNAYGVYEGIAVDTHVHRIVQRLRLVDLDRIGKGKQRYFKREEDQVLDFKKGANTDKIEQELMQVIPQEDWFMFTYLIIEHGRAVCIAIKPKCGKCLLADLCLAKRS